MVSLTELDLLLLKYYSRDKRCWRAWKHKKEILSMKCPKCRTDNPETNKFCPECGTKFIKNCPQCGAERFLGRMNDRVKKKI